MKIVQILIHLIFFDPIEPKLPKPLGSHTKTELDNNLLVIGGISILEPQSSIYSLGCSQGNCIWTTLSQRLSAPRYSAIAMVIPSSLTNCARQKISGCKEIE